jgi:hypothetical protein
MVFNTTFNNISAKSWRSRLLVGETGVPGENHQPDANLLFLYLKAVWFYIRLFYLYRGKQKEKTITHC